MLALMRRYQHCRSMTVIGVFTMFEIVVEIGITLFRYGLRFVDFSA